MMPQYGGYPRCRLLVACFIEAERWAVERLRTLPTADKATNTMRANEGS